MSILAKPAVQRVAKALGDAGITPDFNILAKSPRDPEALAKVLDVSLSSLVVGVPCVIGRRFVLAFIAGGRDCLVENLPRALNLEGEARKAAPEHAKATTGFPLGGIAPVGALHPLPTVLDVALKKPERLYCPAGDPGVTMSLRPAELKRLTGAIVSYNIAKDAQ